MHVSLICSEEPEGGPFAWGGRVRHGPLGVAAGRPATGGEGGHNRLFADPGSLADPGL